MTKFERLLLIEINELKKQIAIMNNDEESVNSLECKIEALENGYASFYDCSYIQDEKTEEWEDKILDILDMYCFMHNSIENNQNPPYQVSVNDVRFPGFDGNNESDELYFVDFIINKQNRFCELKENGRNDFNSHIRMMPKYERMLDVFKELGKPVILSNDEIIKILNIK